MVVRDCERETRKIMIERNGEYVRERDRERSEGGEIDRERESNTRDRRKE